MSTVSIPRWITGTWRRVDGGSVQEECAYLGVPCLVLRAHTERPDGVGENVTVAPFDASAVDRFLADPTPWRRSSRLADAQPSRLVVETLQRWERMPPAPRARARWSPHLSAARFAGRSDIVAPGRRPARQVGGWWGWLVSCALLAWLGWLIAREAARVTVWPGAAAAPAWAVAVLLQLVATVWAAWWWTHLARTAGVLVGTRRLLRAWAESLLAKYLPGGVWQMASRWYLVQGAGGAPSASMLAIVLEQAYVVLAGLVVLLAARLSPSSAAAAWPLASPWSSVVLAALLVAAPVWLPRGVRWALRRAGVVLDTRALSPRRWLASLAAYALYWIVSLAAAVRRRSPSLARDSRTAASTFPFQGSSPPPSVGSENTA